MSRLPGGLCFAKSFHDEINQDGGASEGNWVYVRAAFHCLNCSVYREELAEIMIGKFDKRKRFSSSVGSMSHVTSLARRRMWC